MGIINSTKNYLANNKIEKYLDKELQDKLGDEPAQLFLSNSQTDKFPSIILFNKFGISEGNTLTMQSDITTHYTEDNVAIQDHWAIPPDTYTLSGLIGEVIYYAPTGITQTFSDIIGTLQPITSLIPTLGNYTRAAVNLTFQIESSINRYAQIAKSAYASLSGGAGRQTISNQEHIVNKLKSARNYRQLVDINTPYGYMRDMAITNIVVRQQDSLYVSNVEISLQKWRFVGSSVREATSEEKDLLSGIKSIQASQETDKGQAQGQNVSLLSGMFNKSNINLSTIFGR